MIRLSLVIFALASTVGFAEGSTKMRGREPVSQGKLRHRHGGFRYLFSIGSTALAVMPLSGIEYDFVDPPEAGLGLYLLGRDKKMRIQSLADFKGHVRIGTEDAALAYVRLLTSRRTFYCLSEGFQGEIVAREHLDKRFTFGDIALAKGLKSYYSGLFGVISLKELVGLSLEEAKVRKTKDGYAISRYVLSNPVADLLYIHEFVGNDGSYMCRRSSVSSPKAKRFHWEGFRFL